MIELKTVLELAKEMQPWRVAKMTGYTTAQVNHILKKYGQQPFTVQKPKSGISRVQGERRTLLIKKIKSVVEYKKQHNVGTVPAVRQMGLNIPPMSVNYWIRQFRYTGEL